MKYLTFALALVIPASGEEPPSVLPRDGSALTLKMAESQVILNIHNPGNHAWLVRSSPDLRTWTDHSSHRVFNGALAVTVAPEGLTQFYQIQALSEPTMPATMATALNLPQSLYNYANPTLPAHFQTPVIRDQDNEPSDNRVSNAGATLGRVLFYDKRLSANHQISCASCHQAAHGFSDPARFSVGYEGELTGRNSMGLTNARYYLRENFFWDERSATLEHQTLQPIQDTVEMGMTLDVLNQKASAEPYYQELFTAAFGDAEISSDRISRALSQFVRSIVSTDSKYDRGVPVNFTNFTMEENRGRQIYQGAGGCASCHGSDNFVPGNAIFNNGLENPYIDKGLGGVTGRAADEGLFKVPSLRNIELTAPYMHDGRFASLEQVVEFYNSQVVAHPNLSAQLRVPPTAAPRRLNLSNPDKAALVAFLKTLTDRSITTDPKFSDPFRYGN